MENEKLIENIGQVLKRSRGEPSTFNELITCILDLEQEGVIATCPKVVRRLWPEEWKQAKDKVDFEIVRWNLLCKRRREINDRIFDSDLCFNFFIELSQDKQFHIVSGPQEIYNKRMEELERNLNKTSSKEKKEKVKASIIELIEKFKDFEKSETSDPIVEKQERNVFPGTWKRWAAAIAVLIVAAVAGIMIGKLYFNNSGKGSTPVDKMTYAPLDKPSIAVLPFVNMSDDPDQEYFSDGITESIITSLAKLPTLLIISRNSTFTYKGRAVKVQEVGHELDVQYVLEGSVQRSEDRVRITVQLTDTTSGHHLWAERCDKEIKDIFTLQDEITMKIMEELQVKLTDGEQARLAVKNTKNVQAYSKYLLGRHYALQRNPDDNIRAQRMFEEAIELDPEYANAYAGLAGVSKSKERANNLIQKALTIDETNYSALVVLGFQYYREGQHEKAIAKVKHIVALYPNQPAGYRFLGLFLVKSGKPEEGIPYIKKAIRLNPMDRGRTNMLGGAYRDLGRYEEAIPLFKETLQYRPKNIRALLNLASAYAALGRETEARSEVNKVLQIDPDMTIEKRLKMDPYKNLVDNERFSELLRKAGLP